jgi:cellulose synthase/poly-beta-1,6-N-acetylglucosamine synthase-like glycosyltransferase
MTMSTTYDSNSVQVCDDLDQNNADIAGTELPESVPRPRQADADAAEVAEGDIGSRQHDQADDELTLADLADLAETEVDLDLADLDLDPADFVPAPRSEPDDPAGPAEATEVSTDPDASDHADTDADADELAAGPDAEGDDTDDPDDEGAADSDDAELAGDSDADEAIVPETNPLAALEPGADAQAEAGLGHDPDIDTAGDPDADLAADIDSDSGDCAGARADESPELSAGADAGAWQEAQAPVRMLRTEAETPEVPEAEADHAAGQRPLIAAPRPGFMKVGDRDAPIDATLAASGFGYERYTNLAGPITSPPEDEPYQVQYRGIHGSRREWIAIRAITLILVALDFRFMYWLLFQSQYPHLDTWLWQSTWHAAGTDGYVMLRAGMAVGSIVMQAFLLVNILTVSRACLAARDPIPVEPESGLRVAFLTTIVPDREPIEVAERTLRAAREIVYDGHMDLWLLDEGDSEEARQMCDELGVHHFSRKGRGYLDLETGTFASKTKHGNHNRWLWEHAGGYDLIMFVDPDHVPLPIMAERMLGYFRDPEVAFVVAPQFYGNTENRITRWAESAQYLFHSVIQRAGNRRRCPMLVGTNAALRTSAIRQGYVASITEDMATSLKIHTTKSEVTGRAWRSVYTPDLVAVGEGPSTWTEFFGQQTRWSAGTYDALLHQVWRTIFKLRPGAMLHYLLMLTYYPSVALGWLMGITISACYLGFGITSLQTNEVWWLSYYVDVAAMQFLLYRFMRRHNVSPHEPAGSSGISGMVVSALTAPIYARALVKVLLGRKLTFNVTAKGASAATDRLHTFRYSLVWALVPLIVLAVAITRHRPYPMMIGWTAIILTVCLAPVAIWLWDRGFVARRRRAEPAPGDSTEPTASSADANLTSVAS